MCQEFLLISINKVVVESNDPPLKPLQKILKITLMYEVFHLFLYEPSTASASGIVTERWTVRDCRVMVIEWFISVTV